MPAANRGRQTNCPSQISHTDAASVVRFCRNLAANRKYDAFSGAIATLSRSPDYVWLAARSLRLLLTTSLGECVWVLWFSTTTVMSDLRTFWMWRRYSSDPRRETKCRDTPSTMCVYWVYSKVVQIISTVVVRVELNASVAGGPILVSPVRWGSQENFWFPSSNKFLKIFAFQ